MPVRIVNEFGHEALTAELTMVTFNLGGTWTSFCPELGIQTEGRTPEEALDVLKTEMAESLLIARNEHVPAGTKLSVEEVKALLVQHRQEEGPVRTASWRPNLLTA